MSTVHCMWCGGANCKWENWELYKNLPNTHIAVEGVYSTWVTDSILATARPSSRYIKSHRIVEQFVDKGIKAIVCLQLPGEHALCGDGLQPGGFSYRPEEFMNAGVHFYNFGWTDMTVPTLDLALSAVQVVCYIVSTGGKVAVHCHAGLGRTGLVIACSLVMMGMTVDEAIYNVRMHRRGSIQTKRQEEFITRFSRYLHELRVLFAMPKVHHTFSLEKAIRRQRRYLHGEEHKRFGFAPKLLRLVHARLVELLNPQAVRSAASESEQQSLTPPALPMLTDRTHRSQSMGPAPLPPLTTRDRSPRRDRALSHADRTTSSGSLDADLLLANLNDILLGGPAAAAPRGAPRRSGGGDDSDGSPLPSLRAGGTPRSNGRSVGPSSSMPVLGALTTPRGSSAAASGRGSPGERRASEAESTTMITPLSAGRASLTSSGNLPAFASPRNGSPRGSAVSVLPALTSPPAVPASSAQQRAALASSLPPAAWSPRSEAKAAERHAALASSSNHRGTRPNGVAAITLDAPTSHFYPERRRSADLGRRTLEDGPLLPGAVEVPTAASIPASEAAREPSPPPTSRRLGRKASVELATVTMLDVASTIAALSPQNSDEFHQRFESTPSSSPRDGSEPSRRKGHTRSASDSAVEVTEVLPFSVKLPPLAKPGQSGSSEMLGSPEPAKQDFPPEEGPASPDQPPWLDITVHLQRAREKHHRLDYLKNELNADRYTVLNKEADCWLLFLLAVDWVDHFKEPVINAGTMDYLLKSDDATLIFNALPKPVALTLESFIGIVETLSANSSRAVRSQLFARVAASLLKHSGKHVADAFLRTKHALETEKLAACLEQAADMRWKPRTRVLSSLPPNVS